MTARSCSARAGVKRIYMRMPDSRTNASTCFAAAVLLSSGVEKFIPRSSTACFRRCRASVNLVQTSITCLQFLVFHTGRRARQDVDQCVTYDDLVDRDLCTNKTKDYSREGAGRQRGPQQGRKDIFFLHRSGIEFPTRGKSAGTDMAAYQ